MEQHTTLQSVLSLARTGTVVFSDAEYLHGSLATKKRPEADVWKYAVQIGTVKYEKGTKINTFSALIRPSSILSSSFSSSNDHGMEMDEEGGGSSSTSQPYDKRTS